MAGSGRPVGADVVVIGGGIVGASAAAHLASSRRRVVLVERTAIGAGASGRNSGVIQHPFDPVLVDLHRRTVELYRALASEDVGFELPERPAGLLAVTRDADGARRLARGLATSYPGLGPTYLAPGEVRRLEPEIADDVAACRVEIGYPVPPMAATNAYAALAARRGVTSVVGLAARPTLDRGRVTGVALHDGGTIATEVVVVAAGPWTPGVIDPSGSWRPIRSVWGVVASVALPNAPRHVLEEAEIEIEPGGSVGPPGHAFSLVTADGSSSLGSTFLDHEPDAATLVPSIVERGARFVPAIASAAVGAVRSCARPQSRDGRPLVGRIPSHDGLWVAAGHGPWGISTGPATGELLAQLVGGRIETPPIALDPGRFGGPGAEARQRQDPGSNT